MAQAEHYLEKELNHLIQSDPDIWTFLRAGSLDGVWYWDLEKPEHEYMSPEFWRLFGFDPADKDHLVSEWQDLIFPEDLETATENFNRHLADPDHPYDQVVRYKCADGSTAWVRCRGLAIRDSAGKPIRLLGAHNDLTAQKIEERAARENSALLSQIMESAQSGIIGFDNAGKIISINSPARHLLGGLSAEAPFSWPDSIAFIDRETLQPVAPDQNPIQRVLAGQSLHDEVFAMTDVNEREHRYVRLTGNRTPNESDQVQCVVILDDITEQERNRQQIDRTGRLDALGQLTGGIAHDFNNLLATVQYALELAATAETSSRQDAYLATAKQSVERGAELTKRLLTFAKQQRAVPTSNAVSSIIEETRKLTVPLIEASISVQFETRDKDLFVYCDHAQLGNAILNLILNARDAIIGSKTGDQITVQVRGIDELDGDATLLQENPNSYVAKGLLKEEQARQMQGDNTGYRYVEISVSDNGPGMSDEIKRRAIDPFFSTKAENAGTGLGLSMVYGFIQQSGGVLRLYSEPGQGTTIRMLLPRGTAYGKREDRQEQQERALAQGERILLVEDEMALRMMMQDLISGLGYDIETARTGEEARDILRQGDQFDLIITDIVMPGKVSGFKLAAEVKRDRPDQRILYMSGYTGYTSDDMGDVKAPLLQKPCPPVELATAIRTALDAS